MEVTSSAGEVLARGELKSAVVSAIERLGANASPSSIDAYLAPRLDRLTVMQQVHTALVRMEKQGLVERTAQKNSSSRGRPQTIFGFTDQGRKKLLR
jgi:predicted ArsR family transcriptional regulator